jgi:hypothetical protein
VIVPAAARRPLLPVAAAGVIAALMGMALVASLSGASLGSPAYPAAWPAAASSSLALSDIPAATLVLYRRAGARFGIDWAILAGIGKVECDHGRDPAPSCSREGAVNAAGAGGPMQFLAATWASYGVDGSGDGLADRWDGADAIFSAANYLRAAGAPGDYRRALLSYNHAGWYVHEVERWARRYRSSQDPATWPGGDRGAEAAGSSLAPQTETPVRLIAGERAMLAPGNGHVALIPVAAPPVVQAMLVAGNELQQLPYGPEGHPDPLGAPAEDCSSTINYVLYRSGVRPLAEILRLDPLAQDYVGWGLPGPGRWVTIYSTRTPTAHVGAVIAGLRLDTSHSGTDVGPNRAEDGPRWRVLDHIPTWARWSVRHPPGL